MSKALDISLVVAGVLSVILILGTVVLQFVGRDIGMVIRTGDLAVLGFWFSKGVGQALSQIASRINAPPAPPAPPEAKR